MTGPVRREDGRVIQPRTPTQAHNERAREIAALFPGWMVWHSAWSGAWNACREGEEPYFGRPASGRRFMVSAYDAATLVVLLEQQVGLDVDGVPGLSGEGGELGRLVRGLP
jgi:hypothetical protein